jgi:YVTN family beta-propeller protein
VIALSRDSAALLATIPVGKRPSGLAARSDGDRIYVACAGSHTVEVIDGATRKVLDRVALTHGAAPEHVVLGPLEQTLWVAAAGMDVVYAFDAASLQQIGEIPVGRQPTRLAVAADGRQVYALSAGSGRVDILDAQGMKPIASTLIGSRPRDIALDPRTGSLYVVRSEAPILSVIPEGSAQAQEVSIDAPAEAVAVGSVARRLVLSMPASGRIAIVAPATGAATKVISAPEVSRVAIDPEGTRLYALSARSDLLFYIDQTLGTIERKVPVEKEPWDLVLIP